jgi:hypothetical protein
MSAAPPQRDARAASLMLEVEAALVSQFRVEAARRDVPVVRLIHRQAAATNAVMWRAFRLPPLLIFRPSGKPGMIRGSGGRPIPGATGISRPASWTSGRIGRPSMPC